MSCWVKVATTGRGRIRTGNSNVPNALRPLRFKNGENAVCNVFSLQTQRVRIVCSARADLSPLAMIRIRSRINRRRKITCRGFLAYHIGGDRRRHNFPLRGVLRKRRWVNEDRNCVTYFRITHLRRQHHDFIADISSTGISTHRYPSQSSRATVCRNIRTHPVLPESPHRAQLPETMHAAIPPCFPPLAAKADVGTLNTDVLQSINM